MFTTMFATDLGANLWLIPDAGGQLIALAALFSDSATKANMAQSSAPVFNMSLT